MKTRLMPGLLVAALLIAAQGALAIHAFEHEPGTPQGKVCTTCVTATQLDAGSVDMHAGDPPEPAPQLSIPTASRGFDSVHTAPVRQRGPPSSS